MKLSTHRHSVVAIAVMSIGLLSPPTPALAAAGSSDPSLLSRFFPTEGQVTLATDSYSSYAYQWTYWQAPSRIAHLRDSDGDAYEHEAMIHTGSGFCWTNAGYDRKSWDSDYPYAYLDTDASDTGFPNRAGGSGKSRFLATGRYYYHWLRVKGKCENGMPYNIKAQDSHRSGSCSAGYQWCVYSDSGSPRDVIPVIDNYTTGNTYGWVYQRLYNDGFEDGTAGWRLQGANANYPAKWGVYASSGALDRSRYMSFNCNGGPGCWLYQYAPYTVTSDDIWTAEVGLRCRPSSSSVSSCPVSLALSGIGGFPDEHVSRSISVPADGKWHVYGYRGSQYSYHYKMRFMLTNDSTRNWIDVDLATLHHSDRY